MTKVLSLIIVPLICAGTLGGLCWGQNAPIASKENSQQSLQRQQTALSKQAVLNDLEGQIKDTPLAAVRVLARYQIAAWLWRDGKDETGRAEELSTKALEELFEKKAEIPSAYFATLRSDIFALLEKNAKGSAGELRKKYQLTSEEELRDASSLLNLKDGDKLAADKIQNSLSNQTELSSMTIWLMGELQSKKSPELARILAEIVSLEESGRSNFSAESLFFAVDFFRDVSVPADLKLRFYNIICNKARAAIPSADADAQSVYDLLTAVMPDIAKNAPSLLSDASVLQYSFRSRISSSMSDSIDANRRIEESSDRLDALISEAEASGNKELQKNLWAQAAQLALKENKFRLSIDLVDKIRAGIDETRDQRFLLWYDQFLSNVSEAALKQDDVESAKRAANRIVNKLSLASVFRNTAIYYYGKQDPGSSADMFNNALKLTLQQDDGPAKVYMLIRLMATAEKIAPGKVQDVIDKIANAINTIPRPGVDDKPETENFKKYVSSIISINERLMPVFAQMVRSNRTEAMDLAGRINVKDIKLMLNYAFLTDSIRLQAASRP